MKTLLAVLLFAASALSQINPALAQAQAACGPFTSRFDTQTFQSLPTAGPEEGKALVYVVEDYKLAPGEMINPTLRVGLDGVWTGATQATSYLYFSVDPGEHHLCTNWQSSLKRFSQLIALAQLNAVAGQTYYFRAHVTYSTAGEGSGHADLVLERLDPDEGRFLVASSRLSKSHPKK
ncbi:MAG: DUF2846 domain-containing protein [Terriglobia bacterium]|jgi:hypothetical protein